jgi:undecaprenyl-diphosphatase
MELTVVQSIILGIVQGITEFLPISSSGHLVIVQYIFDIRQPEIAFVVALHVGSLLAVLIYFWRDWLNLFGIKKDMLIYRENPHLLWFIVLATLPAAIGGLLFNDIFEKIVFSEVIIALLIVVGSFFLFISDKLSSDKKSMKDIVTISSLIIGLFQIMALIPGVSRSGMTISGARLCGLNRVDAARFSFLISAPIIAGAGILQMRNMVLSDINHITLIGMIVSFFVAILTIHYFLALIRKMSYALFLYYSIGFFILMIIIF